MNLNQTSELGQISKLEKVYYNGVLVLTPELFAEYCKEGYQNVLKWLLDQGCPFDGRGYYNARINNHKRCLEFLDEIGCNEDIPISNKTKRFDITQIIPSYVAFHS